MKALSFLWCPFSVDTGHWAGVFPGEGGLSTGSCGLLQTHQTIVVQLLQSTMRLLECPWLQQQHKGSVEACIRTLAMVGECARPWPAPGHPSPHFTTGAPASQLAPHLNLSHHLLPGGSQ